MSDDDTMSDDDSLSSNMNESSILMEQKLNESAFLSLQEHHRHEAQADKDRTQAKRCRDKAAQYLEEAQVAEERVKRRCVQSKKAQNLFESLRFEALCHALQRNDPDTTETRLDGYFKLPPACAQLLGEALQDNTHVSKVALEVPKLIPPLLGAHDIASFVAPLMRFIRTSKSLRHVSMWAAHGSSVNNLLMEEIFNAVFQNQGQIDTLDCHCDAPIMLLCNGMQSSTSLKTVDIRFGVHSSHDERTTIEAAFRSMTSLKSLRFETQDVRLATSILNGLKVSNCELQELKLGCDLHGRAYWAALSEFTQAAEFLTHLEMQWQTLNEANMDFFLHCLYGQSSILKLSFNECSMDLDAMHLLKRFMRLRKEGATSGVSALRDLAFEWMEKEGVAPWSGSSFASMFSMGRMEQEYSEGQSQLTNEEDTYSTIGSGLRSLTLTPVSNGGDGFLIALARSAHCIELTKLSVNCRNYDDCQDVARFIAKTPSLQELDLAAMDDDYDYYSILCSLEANGTLLTVTIPGEIESRFANSFCLRNKLLGQLLHNLVMSDQDDKKEDSTGRSVVNRGPLSLLPSLLHIL
jgi:hypothetical protein